MTFNPILRPCDHILLGGEKSPGIAVLSNAHSPRLWDERRGFALSGARVIYKGIGLAYPVVTLKLFTSDDFERLATWSRLCARAPVGTRAHALDIWHPILEDRGITSVVVKDVRQPEQDETTGVWTMAIEFIEFRRPVLTLETIDASDVTPSDPVDQFIANLTNQVNVLAGGPQS